MQLIFYSSHVEVRRRLRVVSDVSDVSFRLSNSVLVGMIS